MTYKSYNSYKNYNNYNNYSGGYKSLPFYKQVEIIYDFTVEFCSLYINPRSRTYDQMVQVGRSGKQNISEGYMQKSLERRIRLLGISRGSLEELLKDYEDFLRQRNFQQWLKDYPEAAAVRRLGYNHYKSYNDYKIYISDPEKVANVMICLINQTNKLLDQKLRWLEEKFIEGADFERIYLKSA